ncbi:hypothetical protein [Eggerthella sp. YY7918]|uniref:nucleotide-binding protein n=1 Tax=Eggerthella sp. (strain YY7918) TaxID=502558 RepID=UPI0002171720|nr:hypothetical protein [Eggerthella sp. YY7918]BAK44498.1 hypothetical protein EGYY_13460 [Eggerthella sp. YY7918]
MAEDAWTPSAPVLIVVGHYGVGKTNLSLNLALDGAARGMDVTLADLDVVNPYFRSSDYTTMLEEAGVRMIAPVMAGTTLDSPSLSGQVTTAIEQAQTRWSHDTSERSIESSRSDSPARTKAPLALSACAELAWWTPSSAFERCPLLIIDAGGDDVGATALGRFARSIKQGAYEMLYVVNRSRNLTQTSEETVAILREIEAKSHLCATAIVNNTHLKQDTDEHVIAQGLPFAQEVADNSGLPLAFTTVPRALFDRKSTLIDPNEGQQMFYPVQVYVRTPWE